MRGSIEEPRRSGARRGALRVLSLALSLASSLGLPPSLQAQQLDGYRAERFRPPPSAEDGLGMPLPDTLGDLVPAFAIVVDYAHRPLVVRSSYGGEDQAIVAHRVMPHLVAALGVTDRVELHLRAPLVFQVGDAPSVGEVDFPPPDVASFADGVLGGSIRLLGEGRSGFHLGLVAEVLLPFSDPSGFVSDREVSARGLVTASVALPTMTLAFAVGGSYRPERPLLGAVRSASELDLGVSLIVPAFLRTALIVEGFLSSGLREELFFQARGSSLDLSFGVRHQLESGLAFELGGAMGFLRAPGTASFRAFGGVRWELVEGPPEDLDGDGLVGEDDLCPHEAEDFDQYEDDDGCPDPDNDGDGVLDARDACPLEPEDVDGWDDDDGCPDPDDDGDGWLDADDACPRVPGVDSQRGCPSALRVSEEALELLEEIVFAEGTARLVPTDGRILDQLAAIIRFERGLARYRFELRPRALSRSDDGVALAQDRIAAIVMALVARGVPPARLLVVDPAELVAAPAAVEGLGGLTIHIVRGLAPGGGER